MPSTVRQIMHASICAVGEEVTFTEVCEVFGNCPGGAVLVHDSTGKLSGIFTERDLALHVAAHTPLDTPLKEIMTRAPRTVEPDASVAECAELMQKLSIRHLPVVNKGVPVGNLTILDVQNALIGQLEHQINEVERFKTLLRHRDDFLAIASHDVRSPMNVVIACCDYLEIKNQDSQTMDEEAKELLRTIRQNADKSVRLVKDLLDLGRLEGGGKLNLSKTALRPYLQQILHNLQFVADTKNIKLTLEPGPEMAAPIDPERFGQVIENLIGNAVKFSPAGKGVTIKVIGAEDGQGGISAHISISDEGPGIPPSKIGQLFTKYHQLGNQTSARQGVGLGLTIAHQFIHLHGGKINVTSDEGKGAVFTVVLPRAEMVQAPAKKADSLKKILVVEDDEDLLSWLTVTLGTLPNIKVFGAKNGEEGFQLFETMKPDMVISDIKMPVSDGFELLGKIRVSRQATPVALISGVYPGIDLELAKNLFRADAMMEKPFSEKDILDLVRRLLPVPDKAAPKKSA
jgi:signal transduction histidine kinase/ActR/RegA family two-component response regulator